MRLAVIRQRYRPGGIVERSVERALEALLERNVAVSLYTRAWPRTRLQLIEPVICNPFHVGALWRDWGFAHAACGIIRRSQPSLVESHERLICCDVYRAVDGVHAVWLEERLKRASTAARISVAISPHDRYQLRAERRLYACPWLRAVICASKMVADEIRSRFDVPESRLHVIGNPVDSGVFHPGLRVDRRRILERHRIDDASTVFLTVAADCERCGVGTAIDALAEIRSPAHLIVVGGGTDLERLRESTRARGLADRVTFAGTPSDLRPYYGAADAFVLPSLYDPSPGNTLEAMACGVPVITSTKSGAAELLQEFDAGLVCPSGSATALAAHMRTLLDPAARAHCSANARRAVQPLTPSAMTLRLVLLYRDLLAAPMPATMPPVLDARASPSLSVSAPLESNVGGAEPPAA